MSAVSYCFLEPLDVLFLRGNKLFGDPGSFGESLIPPWPSVAAGALRSAMLAQDGVDLAGFAGGRVAHPTLGTVSKPGPFAVTEFQLGRRYGNGGVEALYAPPADLVICEKTGGGRSVKTLVPARLPSGQGRISSSAPLSLLPVMAETERTKPAGGYWLTEQGWRKYLKGLPLDVGADLVSSRELWAIDPRVGVGLDAASGRAADGRLFTVQAVAFVKREHLSRNGFDVGFLVGVTGTEPLQSGLARLGGDGRAAAMHPVSLKTFEPDFGAMLKAKRCRLVLTTPGIFGTLDARDGAGAMRSGWLPTGITQTSQGEFLFDLHGVKGKLVCAAVPRFEVVSGWDLALWQPKPAQRVAPTGSVYWLQELEATPDALRRLIEQGLWPATTPELPEAAADWQARRAEGFNRCTLGVG